MHIYSHLLTNGSVASLSDLSNILVLCKSIAENTFVSTQKCCLIDVALSALSQYLSFLEAADEDSVYCTLLLHFICNEQLQLLQMPKYGRRYSANLITLYFLWQLTSSALYKKLNDTLIFAFNFKITSIFVWDVSRDKFFGLVMFACKNKRFAERVLHYGVNDLQSLYCTMY